MPVTPVDGIYFADADTTVMEIDTITATMASSIENGIGKRLKKLETFVGCNIGLGSFVTGTSTITKVTDMQVNAGKPQEFVSGVTVLNGTVTVPEAGLYSVLFLANFLPTNTTASRLNTYVYVNGVSYNFSSAYGETDTTRYSNCNVTAVYNLKKNDQIDVRIATYDGGTKLASASLSVALMSRIVS